MRYRISVKGLDLLTPAQLTRGGGVLFLPNHPAELDPVILMLLLWKHFRPRPLVVEHFFYLKGIEFLMKLVRALPLPNLNGITNKWKVAQVEKMQKAIAEVLKKGENFIIYPAGKLKLEQQEVIGGSSFVHSLLTDCPQANVVLVRTKGLWGSLFSRALTGNVPDFGPALFKGIKIILKNGIFFTPRRLVEIEMTPAPDDFPFGKPRLELNRYLEEWYNQKPDEIKLVSYTFWKKELPEVYVSKRSVDRVHVLIPKEVESAVFAEVAKLAHRPVEDIHPEMLLAQDLGFDSLDIAELNVFLDRRYDVSHLAPGSIKTVHDLLLAAVGCMEQEEEKTAPKQELTRWSHERARPSLALPEGKTIQEAFLRACNRMKGHLACADTLSGMLTYRTLKRTALVLSQKIAQLPGKNIGVLLPSSSGANIVILATLLAGKVPVMLNWTAGKRSLDHSIDIADIQVVLSSYRFLSRLENGDLGKLEDKLVFLEEVRRSISLREKLKGLVASFKNVETLVQGEPDDVAVILFTSGTETLPKGVPLTHKNILSNHRAALSSVDFRASDVLYSVLPPFHSFGFSITGILPLLVGLRVLYAPDPTDSRGMARDIAAWKPTLLACAPSFMTALFRVAELDQLKSLRLIVSGAEKAPQELFDAVKQLGSQLLEGYGITECSPVVTLVRQNIPSSGVGQPLPDVKLCIVDLESAEPLPVGAEGEVCIRGPNVFRGYLGNLPAPFIEVQGKKWYRSGDRGSLTPDGSLVLSGRLKRFVKIGGEMVSLGGLETELLRLAKEKNWHLSAPDGPTLAVTAREKQSDKPLIVLFTTFDVERDVVNAALQECGFGRIVKIAEVRRLEQIPLTGTGKTHYRLLDDLC